MLFNSISFLLFFPLVCVVYYILPHKLRRLFLLVISYFFYMNWQPIYGLLLFGATALSYMCALFIEKYSYSLVKRAYLMLGLFFIFGILFVYKYFNFINESIFALLQSFNLRWSVPDLKILLPIGISFYTFQIAGYLIDVFYGKIKAERNFVTYALFVSFFPQLSAGPIGRASSLMPQFILAKGLRLENLITGGKLMIWGYFMKLVVADRLCIYVNAVFGNLEHHSGITMLLAVFLFTFQIYCDFAGYSNIAIGAAKVMGYDLMQNFARPYLATSMGLFWRKWHISLSSWFRDYIYIPLGGNRVPYLRHLLNLFITFLVSGIWHGANWTFLVWGALHGIYLVIENIKNRFLGKFEIHTTLSRVICILYCFVLSMLGWVFFRANTVEEGFYVIKTIFTDSGEIFLDTPTLIMGLSGLIILISKDIYDEYIAKSESCCTKSNIFYLFILVMIFLFGVFDGGQFIYFQF